MISKINELKNSIKDPQVKAICDSTIAALSSTIYNGVTPEAKHEIERVSLENLFEELSKYNDDTIISEWLSNQKRIYSVKNLGIRKAINNLALSEGKYNPSLMSILEQYREHVENIPEVLLYESFVPALLNFNYIPAVTQQVDFIKNAVKKYKTDVEISKIIESMKSTRSNYLLPLIEGAVDSYLNNKNSTTKWQLKNTLIKFSYDDFIRNIINLIDLDAAELQLEYVNAQCDIEKIYSPIYYLGENEAVFNIKGVFYIKKGNHVNKLSEENIINLDKNFISLCETLNSPNVFVINNEIVIYDGNDKAVINENETKINDKVFTSKQIVDTFEVATLSGKSSFFETVYTLHENFNEIAEVDFVKRVYLKEDESHSADVFRLRDNICIATYSKEEGKTTLYRNINPIQAKNVMMEHLRYDVSKVFEDILPNQEKILAEIEETKLSYSSYILTLESKIEEMSSKNNNKTIQQVLDALNEELDEVKEEYKDYLNTVQSYTQPLEEGITISLDVDGEEYTIPIPQKKTDATTLANDLSKPTEEPASEITFDEDESEALTDAPSAIDNVDLGAEEVEKQADELEKEKEEETPEENKEEGKEGEEEEEEKDIEDVKVNKDEDEEEEEEEKEKVNDSDNLQKNPFIKESLNEGTKRIIKKSMKILKDNDIDNYPGGDEIDKKPVLLFDKPEDAKKAKNILTKNGVKTKREDSTLWLIEESKEETLKKKRVFLKKKLNEGRFGLDQNIVFNILDAAAQFTSDAHVAANQTWNSAKELINYLLSDHIPKKYHDEFLSYVQQYINESKQIKDTNKLNEDAQLLDTVRFEKDRAFVVGKMSNGDLIVQLSRTGQTKTADPSKVKVLNVKAEQAKPQFKFDKETQKVLFEQLVKCGIYMNNVPIKTSNCFTMYSEWKEAKPEDHIKVLIENEISMIPRSQVNVFDDPNDFANPDDYVEGVIIDQEEKAIDNILINAIDYTDAIGDSDPVRVIINGKLQTLGKGMLRTLAV